MRYSSEEWLHRDISLHQVIENQRHAATSAVNALAEYQLKKDQGQLVTELADRFSINVPILDRGAITSSKREIDIDVSRDPTRVAFHFGRSAVVKGTEITITVPFKGDRELFRVHAGNHLMSYPKGIVGKNEISFICSGDQLKPESVRKEFDEWLEKIEGHLAGITKELGAFNESIAADIDIKVKDRVRKIESSDDLLKGIGFPTRDQ